MFEQFNELAKQYARFDDGLDDDFVEEEWQFVHGSDDDEDEDDDFLRAPAPNYLEEDEEDEEDDEEDYEDDEDDLDWDAGTEDYEDDEDSDDWYEEDEED